ncbi:MAG: hypothetical protein KGP33_02315 [Betaproteobacteria bacterium]|jgi:hypothetical protein|nr:hypothetical protein [Betaproteobacteria bacterium]
MRLLTEPRILESKVGAGWLSEGFSLFHRQPLGWTLILFIYWAAMLMAAFIPIFGLVLPLLLTPGLSMGFIEISRAIDRREPPRPPLLISAFRSAQAKAVLILGAWYVLEITVIMLVSYLIDDGVLIEWITLGQMPKPEQIAAVQTAGIVSFLLYIPVMMAFWFAPQLVVWSGFTPVKALFYSFFAVWRNKGAFIRYAITWIGLTLFVGVAMALVNEIIEMKPSTVTAFLFPITLILMAVAHGSFYASTKAVFGPEEETR